jgi:predicted nucleotidyltransferase
MGGAGGSSYIGPMSETLQQKIDHAQQKEQLRLDSEINDFVARLLARYNNRDRDATERKLMQIQNALGDDIELDQILYGGSVAKHTEVDGLSDIDALVVLRRKEFEGKSAQEMLNGFHRILSTTLHLGEIESISKGKLAVTIKYTDGQEIQLLPALKSRSTLSIAAADGSGWSDTKPKMFQKELANANRKMNSGLVPAIKLFKSIVYDLPVQKQLTGYHIEALAVDAVKNYTGAKTPKSLLLHLLKHASERVLAPIKDTTGQSRTVDRYLGKAESLERKNISQTLFGMKRRLETATTVSQWRAVFGE